MNFNTLFKSKEEISSSRNPPIFLFSSLSLAVAQRNLMDHLSLLSSQPPHATIDKTSICEAALGEILWVVSPGKHQSDSSAESICSLCLLRKRGIDLSPSQLWSGHSSLEARKRICKGFRQSQEWIKQTQFREDSDKQGMARESVQGLESITYSERLQKKRGKRRLRTQFVTVYGHMNLLGYCSGAIIDARCLWEHFLNIFSYPLRSCGTNHNLMLRIQTSIPLAEIKTIGGCICFRGQTMALPKSIQKKASVLRW